MTDQVSPPSTGPQLEPRVQGELQARGSPGGSSLPVPLPAAAGAIIPVSPPPERPRRWRGRLGLLILLLGGIGGGAYWWFHAAPALPPGIVFSNGRLEADEIDIATKFAGRIAQILADEGDMVRAGQVVARIDTRDLEAQLAQAEAQIAGARDAIAESQAVLAQQGSQVKLAAQELQRARTLVRQDFETREMLDQRQSQFDVAVALYHATQARIATATASMEAAIHSANLIRVNIADDTLVAPKDGPIQYRLANIGEVLAVGGKVFTMLDVTYVYMDVFLPTGAAGKVKLGDEARILLDASPDQPIPARVTFIASQNQFTPKMVETRSERDKLMFRVRVRIDPKLLRAHEAEVRSGLPGLAYIRVDRNVAWPAFLQYGGGR
ncbi:MAG TPA: HlyD family efflux transporter periplasmic adaptor subunit [Acetobacteraceae bacterium]|nr:HlyD family efflux transporter periplasmic adaptor subunit [Acetobacteraceae bacterium]